MCQVEEEYSDQLETRRTARCPGCASLNITLIVSACRGCFRDHFVHKFRATLGKNRVIFPGEKVLLAISGGPASCSMLAQVQQGLSKDAPKKLRFVPGIVYIDEGCVTGQSAEERQRTSTQLELIFRATGYPFFIVHLEQVFCLPGAVLEATCSVPVRSEGDYKAAVNRFIESSRACLLSQLDTQDLPSGLLPFDRQLTGVLQKLFDAVKTLTAKEDLLHTLRQHLIVHTARTHGYSKVMMGDSCSRLAVKLLSSICQGRGASLAADTGFCDLRYGDIGIVRPMRDYSSKEIAFYNRMFGVPSLFIPGLDTKTPDKASIQRLTESFVTRLQADFPSTVSTIYRTSEKLQTSGGTHSADAEPAGKCLLCMCALDTKLEEASAFHATLVSEKLSQKQITKSPAADWVPDGQCCSRIDYVCGMETPTSTDLKSLLCYSCRLTIQDMSAAEFLPPYIMAEAERRMRRSQMEEEIAAFLLPEDDAEDREEVS
uniref:Cytoplasmic tRNA 2-thiolation protein 2 n=1 Tax=Scleropages formosus TaxID=113540 RepID=A0A8C9S2U0_SCLFO